MSVQGSISSDNCRLHFPILYIDLHPSCASEEHPGETLRNAVSTHLSRRSSISPHVERRGLTCVSSRHVKDELIGILPLPPVLEYWNIDRQRTRRSLEKRGRRLAFPCGFVVDHRAAIFDALRTYVLISKRREKIG